MDTLEQIRQAGEAEFRDKLDGLERRHRATLLAALEQYGHPRLIPDGVWVEIRREQEEELVAAYLLLMMAGDEWTAAELERQGVVAAAARSDAAYAMQAARQAQRAAAATTDTLRDRLTRRVEDALASPTGGVGQVSTGDLRQALDDVLTPGRREGIAATETTGALTTGQRAAAERAKGGDGATLADGQRVEIEMRWSTEQDDRVCPRCSPLEGQPEEVWALVFPDGPGEDAHTNCRCSLSVHVIVLQSVGESFRDRGAFDPTNHDIRESESV
jgi:murein DD-endopeptidase MepM/ murein hydrolase activator NlpD